MFTSWNTAIPRSRQVQNEYSIMHYAITCNMHVIYNHIIRGTWYVTLVHLLSFFVAVSSRHEG